MTTSGASQDEIQVEEDAEMEDLGEEAFAFARKKVVELDEQDEEAGPARPGT